MNIKNSLENLGLSQNEISIYLYLLSKGESLGNQIRKDNQLDKSTSYKAITQLLRKGLITSSGDSRNQKFKVAPKDVMLKLFDKQKAEIDDSKSIFLNAFADLEKYSADYYQNENVKIFVGSDAYTRYHKEILREEIETIRTITSSETAKKLAGGTGNLKEGNEWFIKERVSRDINVKVLYDISAIPDEYDVSNIPLLKECRRYSQKLNLESMMSTFGDRVGFATIKEGKFWALIIKDQLIVDLLNSLFESIWIISTKS
ncbi:hypothetical protein HYV12_01685 [Candidatus Dojkabacteria bacterium]|nr:hypothetical protein [Candidatus Dojkabacteria bacterium]